MYSFVFIAGNCDFANKILANSLALSSGVIAQLPSARCSAGMFSEVPAFVGNVLATFHRPREEGSKDLSIVVVLLTYSLYFVGVLPNRRPMQRSKLQFLEIPVLYVMRCDNRYLSKGAKRIYQ